MVLCYPVMAVGQPTKVIIQLKNLFLYRLKRGGQLLLSTSFLFVIALIVRLN